MTIFFLVLLTYFVVISGLVYDIIMEPSRIGSIQDRSTGAVQYIIEGLSSGFMFMLSDVGLILMNLALDRNRARTVRTSFATIGMSTMFIAYAMSMFFIRIKILGYLW